MWKVIKQKKENQEYAWSLAAVLIQLRTLSPVKAYEEVQDNWMQKNILLFW